MRIASLLVAGCWIITACEDHRPVDREPSEEVMRAPGVEVEDVRHPLERQTVRLAGDVARMLDDQAGSDCTHVMVAGIVRTGIPEIERELGRDLRPETERAIGDRPVIVAHAVRNSPRRWVDE